MLVLRAVTLQWLLLAMRRPAPVVVLLVLGIVVEARPSPPTMHELGKRQCWQPRKVLTTRYDWKVLTRVACVVGQHGSGVRPEILRCRECFAWGRPTVQAGTIMLRPAGLGSYHWRKHDMACK